MASRTPQDDGPPVSVVIYPTPDEWRISTSTKHGAMVCGRLRDVAPDAGAEAAKLAADGLISSLCVEFFGIGVTLHWDPGERPGWWSGTVRRLDGEPI